MVWFSQRWQRQRRADDRDWIKAVVAASIAERDLVPQAPPPTATTSRPRVRVHEHPDATLAVFHGPRCVARHRTAGKPIGMPTRKAA